MSNLSVRIKVMLAVASIFLAVIAVSSYLSIRDGQERVLANAEKHAADLADGYFDLLNTMMLTGVIQNREIARQKLNKHPEVLDVRPIRGKALEQFGPGPDHEKPRDELDRRALAGEEIRLLGNSEEGRKLTIIKPAVAHANKLPGGLTCLNCHLVPEDTVLGAIRIDFSLAERDRLAKRSQTRMLLANLGLFVLGMVIIYILMDRSVIRPISGMLGVIARVAEGDLTRQVEVRNHDELGQIGQGLNQIVGKFREDIAEIQDKSLTLAASSRKLVEVSHALATRAEEIETSSGGVAGTTLEMSEHIGKIAGSAGQITGSVKALSESAGQISHNMAEVDKTVRATDQELTTLDRAGQEMAHTIEGIAATTGETRSMTHKAVASVHQASDQIDNLVAVTREIVQAVTAIHEIAELTATLSLNATIESARAGAAGLGFRVVADEVRSLARQTDKATEAIRERVDAILAATDLTVAEIRNIDSVINSVNDMVDQIAASVEQQSATTRENSVSISRAVTGMGRVAEHISQTHREMDAIVARISAVADQAGQTARTTDETAKNTEGISANIKQVSEASSAGARGAEQIDELAGQLSEMAARLEEMVARFKV